MSLNHHNYLISVVTVVYNGEESIDETILSVLSQIDSEIEYILIDGNSTDRTLEKINRYKNQISQIISEPDKGIYNAMNKGLKIAKGNYVWFINSGDIIINGAIQHVKSKLAYSHLQTVYFGAIKYISKISYLHKPHGLINEIMPHPGTILPRELMLAENGFNETFTIYADAIMADSLRFKYPERVIIDNHVIAEMRDGGISTKLNKSILIEAFSYYRLRNSIAKSIILGLIKPIIRELFILILKKETLIKFKLKIQAYYMKSNAD